MTEHDPADEDDGKDQGETCPMCGGPIKGFPRGTCYPERDRDPMTPYGFCEDAESLTPSFKFSNFTVCRSSKCNDQAHHFVYLQGQSRDKKHKRAWTLWDNRRRQLQPYTHTEFAEPRSS